MRSYKNYAKSTVATGGSGEEQEVPACDQNDLNFRTEKLENGMQQRRSCMQHES